MKSFCIVHVHTVSQDTVVKAKTKEEALKKFREIEPDNRITDVWEVTKQLADSYDY